MVKHRYMAHMVGILLFAFALRLYRIDAQSIWVDEGISLHLANSSLAEIITDRAANIHPPLYFFLLKAWVALTGVNIFSARFLSVIASLLQVPAMYAVARRWMGHPAAHIAAILAATSPLSVVYAQEIRAYALLPVVYLTLLAITHELTHEPSLHRRATWLLLGTAEVIGLHLHYTVLFLVVYIGGWSLMTFWRERRWADLHRWLITQLLVGLASLPWLIATLAHWTAIQAEATAGTVLAQPPSLNYLLAQIWAFHLVGRAGALGRPATRFLSGIIFLTLIVLLLLRLTHSATRRMTTRLASQWLLPLSVALLVWIVRPFSHPRYVTLYTPGLIILAAYAICPNSDPQTPNLKLRTLSRITLHVSRITLIVSLGLISVLGLGIYFFDPTDAKEDIRGAARYLEEEAEPDDLILVPDGDWSLTFVYQGTAPIEMPGIADEESMWVNLALWTAQCRRAFVMNYQQGIGGDQREVVPFALEKAGTLHTRRSFGNILVRQYELDRPVEPPMMLPAGADFGPVTLTQGWVESAVPADTALTLALRWQLKEATDQRYGMTIRLQDIDDWPLASRDTLLLDERIRPTDHWEVGQETTTYHILPIPPGIPPLTYTLVLGLYEQTESTENALRPLDLLSGQGIPLGQWLDLGRVRLTTPIGLTGNPYKTTGGPPPLPQPADLADGLQLLGVELDRSTLSAGQSLFVTLHWQAIRSPLPDLRPRLTLAQAGQELSAVESAPALGRYPTDGWQAGEAVVEHRRLVVPPTATDGLADVVLALGSQRLVLGQVEISAGEHIFTPPLVTYPLDFRFGQVARLIGYDLPSQTFTASEPITLTLYWQALEGAANANYAVFSHILAADGHLAGQHDGPPAGGNRPTLGWVPGEIIIDQHLMTFREPYTGRARIEVGLYVPAIMERVQVEGGDTFVLLPTELTILEH